MIVEVFEFEVIYYIVVSGDSLLKIVKVYYGDVMKYLVIFEVNKLMFSDLDKIYFGQVLWILFLVD